LIVQGATNDLSSLFKSFFFPPWTLSDSQYNGYPIVAVTGTPLVVNAACLWVNFNGSNNQIQALNSSINITQPPSNLAVTPQTVSLGVTSEINNILTWDPTTSYGFLNYIIYRNGTTIGIVTSDIVQFVDSNRIIGETVIYGIAAYGDTGFQSDTATITYTN